MFLKKSLYPCVCVSFWLGASMRVAPKGGAWRAYRRSCAHPWGSTRPAAWRLRRRHPAAAAVPRAAIPTLRCRRWCRSCRPLGRRCCSGQGALAIFTFILLLTILTLIHTKKSPNFGQGLKLFEEIGK